jgi:uracil-DNA glycosylase
VVGSLFAPGNQNEMPLTIPDPWLPLLGAETEKPYWHALEAFVDAERREHTVFPPAGDVFNALAYTPPEEVRVLLLGQDPYHNVGQAHGLCFSVRPGVPTPPSLVNIFKELLTDLGCHIPNNGYLLPWAQQGVLMLNAVLTVCAHQANSHKGHGWETFTNAVIRAVNAKSDPVIFVLWGGYAQKKQPLIDTERHTIIASAHPSPLSARNGFFGSKPFSQINTVLHANNPPQIDWQIPDSPHRV